MLCDVQGQSASFLGRCKGKSVKMLRSHADLGHKKVHFGGGDFAKNGHFGIRPLHVLSRVLCIPM